MSIGANLATDTTQTPPVIGVFGTAPNMLNGSLDELAIWDRALPITEVQALYNAGASGKALTTIILTPPVTGGTLNASIAAGEITVTWNSGALQSAPSPTGPWTDVTTTGNTHTEAVASGAKFFRTR
jgi:hypothetical protein